MLVVLGTTEGRTSGPAWSKPATIQVERVLFGECQEKSITVDFDDQDRVGRDIFLLVSGAHRETPPYVLRETRDPSEEAAVCALLQARVDLYSLSSAAIFVGKEVAIEEEKEFLFRRVLRTVEVDHTVSGARFEPGGRVRVWGLDSNVQDRTPRRFDEPALYVLAGIREEGPQAEKIGFVACRWPTSLEERVRDALAHAADHPIVEPSESGEPARTREIVFRGSQEEGLALLGSTLRPAAALGARYAFHHRAECRKAVVSTIQREVQRLEILKVPGHHLLHDCIAALDMMEDAEPTGAIDALIEEVLARVEEGGPGPEGVPERDLSLRREEDWLDVNHGLMWLLKALGREAVAQRFGQRLESARATAKEGWRAELDLAFAVLELDEEAEIVAALARMESSPRVTTAPGGMRCSPQKLAWSRDGKLLATASSSGKVQVWRVADGAEVAGFLPPANVEDLAFTADDSGLWLGGSYPKPFLGIFDWRTGRPTRQLELAGSEVNSFTLTADGTLVLTVDNGHYLAHLRDAASGNVRRTIEFPSYRCEIALSPDGRWVAHNSAKDTLTVDRTDGADEGRVRMPSEEMLGPMSFSTDGRYLAVVEREFPGSDGELTLMDATGGWNELATAPLPEWHFTALATSADGRFLFAGLRDGATKVYSLPKLEEVAHPQSPQGFGEEVTSAAFSPDGGILALATSEASPYLYETKTWTRIFPSEADSSFVREIYFSEDGKSVWSVCSDYTVRHREVETLNVLRRFALPAGYMPVGTRPDGRYMVLFDEARARDGDNAGNNWRIPAMVLDLLTGKKVCDAELPSSRTCLYARVHWLDEQTALLENDWGLYRFDWRTGEVLKESKREGGGLGYGLGDLTEDGKTLYYIGLGGKTTDLGAKELDLAAEHMREIGRSRTELLQRLTGLVPDGRRFYLGDTGFSLYDRETLTRVVGPRFARSRVFHVAWSGDGARCAFVVELREGQERRPVVVLDSATGRVEFAIKPTPEWVDAVALSSDGQRLAVAERDGRMTVWALPK
ncbi:MAG: WD40 repeat domain-containing protein [Planctomycetota bacterium]